MTLTTSLPWWTKPTGEPPAEPNGSVEAQAAPPVPEPVEPPPVDRYVCPHCGKGIASKQSLGGHVQFCDQNPQPTKRAAWRCPRCQVRFRQPGRHRAACPGPPRAVAAAPVSAPMTIAAAMAALQTAIGKQATELEAMRTQLRRILQAAKGDK